MASSSDLPNLRLWEPKDSSAKNVMDTNMLDTQAHEDPETVDTKNTNVEDTNKTPAFGPDGARGRR